MSVYFLSNIKRNLLYKNIKILGRRVKWLVQDNLNISSDMLTTSQVVQSYINFSFKDENYTFCMIIGAFKRNKTIQTLGKINANIWFLIKKVLKLCDSAIQHITLDKNEICDIEVTIDSVEWNQLLSQEVL